MCVVAPEGAGLLSGAALIAAGFGTGSLVVVALGTSLVELPLLNTVLNLFTYFPMLFRLSVRSSGGICVGEELMVVDNVEADSLRFDDWTLLLWFKKEHSST